MAVVPSALTVFDSDQVLDCSGFIEPLPLSLDLSLRSMNTPPTMLASATDARDAPKAKGNQVR